QRRWGGEPQEPGGRAQRERSRAQPPEVPRRQVPAEREGRDDPGSEDQADEGPGPGDDGPLGGGPVDDEGLVDGVGGAAARLRGRRGREEEGPSPLEAGTVRHPGIVRGLDNRSVTGG